MATRAPFNPFHSKKFLQRLSTIFSTILIALGAVVIMLPIAWMIATSLKAPANVTSIPPSFIPQEGGKVTIDGVEYFLDDVTVDGVTRTLARVKLNPTKSEFFDPANPSVPIYAPASAVKQHMVTVVHWENYATAWNYKQTPFGLYMLNTLAYATFAVIAEVLINSFVAYGFARLKAPGKKWIFLAVLATMMLPYPVTMIPNFVLFTKYIPDFLSLISGTKVVWSDSWWPLYLPKLFGSAYLIFLIRQFYMTIPKEYDEAARIDGANFIQIWWSIILPMSRPVLVAVAVLSFMYHWNEYLGPLIYLNSTVKLPLSVGLAGFQAMYSGTPWHLMMAASMIAVAPLIIIFFVLNRYFIQGVVVSGVKG